MLTTNEVLALDAILKHAIVKSREEDDGDPVFHEVNAADVNPFEDKRTQDEVYASLAEKGMIACSLFEDLSENESQEYVCITPSGFEALASSKGVN